MAMASIDITIVASALPVITTEFNAHDNYTWVIVAYLLANTSLQPSKFKNYYILKIHKYNNIHYFKFNY